MRNLLRIGLALFMVLSLFPFLFPASPAKAADLNVPAGYATIQAAIDAAASGDKVHVAAGTYNEDIILKNGVEVLGAGEAVCTINGTHTGSVVKATSVGATTKLDGFTITNGGTATYGGGIYNK
ncbi:MAG TPA: hypothetical protein VMW37_05690, partial [Dehalococcoidales bacterium]|nr:hypothetical protein [Dehalococcoidales bacterium]